MTAPNTTAHRRDSSLGGVRPGSSPGARAARRLVLWSTLAAVIVLTVAVLGLRSYLDRDRDQAAQDVGRDANGAAVIVGGLLDGAVRELVAASTAPAFAEEDLDGIAEALAKLLDASGTFNQGLAWVDRGGIARVSGADGIVADPIDVNDRSYTRAGLAGDSAVSDVFVSRVRDVPVVVVSAPTHDDAGAVNGVLVGTFGLAGGADDTGGAPALFGDARIAVVDSAGMVIAAQGLAPGTDVTDRPLWEAIQADDGGVLEGVSGFIGRGDQVVGYARVAGTEWRVVAESSEGNVFAEPVRHFWVAFGSIVAATLICLLGAFFLARRLSRNLTVMSDNQQLLSGALAELSSAVMVAEASTGQIVKHNDRFDLLFEGSSPRTVEELCAVPATHLDGRTVQPDEWPLRRALAGEHIVGEELKLPRGDGSAAVVRVSAAPIRARDGSVRRALSSFDDITEAYAARERERELMEVLTAIASARTAQEICRIATDRAVPSLGARAGAVLMADPSQPMSMVGYASCGYPVDFELLRPVISREALVPGSRLHTVQRVDLGRDDQQIPDLLMSDQDRYWLAAPLRSGTDVAGVLFLAFDHVPDDRFLLRSRISGFSAQLAQALDAATRAEQEHDLVVALQQSVLGHLPAQLPGLAVAGRYLPSSDQLNLGGDWYDVIDLGNGLQVLVIGDVVGRGSEAAATMGQVRSAVRALAPLGSLDTVLERLDRFASDPAVPNAFCTSLALVALDTTNGSVTVGLAGHPPPLMRDATGRVTVLDDVRGALLGSVSSARPTFSFIAPPGASFMLYTDGLVEQRGVDLDQRLALLAATFADSPQEPSRACQTVLTAMLTGDERDDVAVMCVRLTGA